MLLRASKQSLGHARIDYWSIDQGHKRPGIRADLRGSRGMISILFVTVVLPIIFIMLVITVELAHFFGVRDEIQRVLDQEAHDALVRGATEEDVLQAVQERMLNFTGLAALTSVRQARSPARSMLEARAEYRGAFFQLLQDLTGSERSVLPIWLQTQVRIQSAAALVIVDRGVSPGVDPCADQGLIAITQFVDRLTTSWRDAAEARVAVGVFPGATQIAPGVVASVELLASDAQDRLPRCRAADTSSSFDLSALRGHSGGPPDPYGLAFDLRDIANKEVVQQPREVRSIVLVLRRPRYEQGYAQSVFNLLKESAQEVPLAIDMYVLVLDDSQTIDSRTISIGINGGVYREIGAAESELIGMRLLGTLSQALTDRIVLEQ